MQGNQCLLIANILFPNSMRVSFQHLILRVGIIYLHVFFFEQYLIVFLVIQVFYVQVGIMWRAQYVTMYFYFLNIISRYFIVFIIYNYAYKWLSLLINFYIACWVCFHSCIIFLLLKTLIVFTKLIWFTLILIFQQILQVTLGLAHVCVQTLVAPDLRKP